MITYKLDDDQFDQLCLSYYRSEYDSLLTFLHSEFGGTYTKPYVLTFETDEQLTWFLLNL